MAKTIRYPKPGKATTMVMSNRLIEYDQQGYPYIEVSEDDRDAVILVLEAEYTRYTEKLSHCRIIAMCGAEKSDIIYEQYINDNNDLEASRQVAAVYDMFQVYQSKRTYLHDSSWVDAFLKDFSVKYALELYDNRRAEADDDDEDEPEPDVQTKTSVYRMAALLGYNVSDHCERINFCNGKRNPDKETFTIDPNEPLYVVNAFFGSIYDEPNETIVHIDLLTIDPIEKTGINRTYSLDITATDGMEVKTMISTLKSELLRYYDMIDSAPSKMTEDMFSDVNDICSEAFSRILRLINSSTNNELDDISTSISMIVPEYSSGNRDLTWQLLPMGAGMLSVR